MKKAWLPFLILIISAQIFSACKKNSVTEQFTETINPVIPDFTTQINASVNGFITDETGAAVQGATVKGGTITVTTDQFGYFKINTAAFAKSAGFVQITKAGYFTGYRTFLPIEGKETFIRLQLIPKTITGTINAATGGTVTTTDGAKITLPANAVVNAATNAAYAGIINVAIHWLNPTEENKTQLTMPGNLLGVDSLGYLKALVTYGMLAVELSGSTGELLQIAPNKKASLNFPIPVAIASTASASIPLWYFDETKGLWKQDGNATKNGNNYEGNVSHFSWWNCDAPCQIVNLQAQIVNNNLQPLANVPVSISIDGQPTSARFMYSDTAGFVKGMVPANNNLTMSVLSSCGGSIVISNVVTANSNIDLGTVTANLQQYEATISGTAVKCNGSPVTDGVVFINGLGSNSVINIHNGAFSAASVICPGAVAYIIASDRETSQQSTLNTFTIGRGINTTGVLQACTVTSPTESVSVNFSTSNNVTYSLPQYLFGGNFYFLNDSTSINAIDLLNGNQKVLQFSFAGPATPGSYTLSGNKVIVGGNTFTFLSNTNVAVYSYGLTGQFITGTFDNDGSFPGRPAQHCQVNFTIKRDQ